MGNQKVDQPLGAYIAILFLAFVLIIRIIDWLQ